MIELPNLNPLLIDRAIRAALEEDLGADRAGLQLAAVDLHRRAAVLRRLWHDAGRGFGISEARPSIELSHRIRHATVTEARSVADLRGAVLPKAIK